MSTRKPKKSLGYFLVTLILLAVIAYYDANYNENAPAPVQTEAGSFVLDTSTVISNQAQKHILYGDARGGGHKYGVNKPCKSEFPKNWDDTKIIQTVQKIAANDNVNWRQEDNGYFVAEKLQDGIKVRVVLGRDKKRVVTAYPTNVKRNPCPANDR